MVRLLALFAVFVLTFAARPAAAAAPVLVVYPFAVSASMADGDGARLADKIAAEITALGGVTVVRGAAGAKPADYRSLARAAGANVYYTGSIVPVGVRYAAIQQLVSTHSGTVTWSTTMQFRGIDDVVGAGAQVRDEVLRGAATPGPQPSDGP
jgi:TolB-like protein